MAEPGQGRAEQGQHPEQRPSPNLAQQALDPLAKLGWRIRRTKYAPSAREAEALEKCADDAKFYILNGALFSGALMWNLTGSGRKLKFPPRVFMTGVAAVIGRDIGGRYAANSCMKRILSLEGSPLRGELIAIMREDFPDHPLLKSNLARDQDLLPKIAREPEEYGYEGPEPASSNEWGVEVDEAGPESKDWAGMLGRGGRFGRERRLPQIWGRPDRQQNVAEGGDGADILADPFDLVMQTGVVDDSREADDKVEDRTERRRSRMSAKERREYDRQQYEHRQEQRTY